MPWTTEGLRAVMEKETDLVDDDLKVALFTSTATINRATTSYTGLANEVAAGNGYTRGGKSLANIVIATDATNHIVWLDADDVFWDAATFSARYAVVYNDTVSAKTILGYYDFGSNQSPSNSRFTVRPGGTSQTAFLSIESE